MKSKTLAVGSIQRVTEQRAKWCQSSGHSATSTARCRALCSGAIDRLLALPIILPVVLLTISLMVSAGCGAGGFNPNNVTVTVSPPTATIPESGQVALQAKVNGECAGCVPFYNWLISENDGAECTFEDTPPIGPCPGGTLQQATGISGPTVTYIAPGAPGTFHVVGQSLYYNSLGPASVIKQGTSVITVSP
jgi:hypothetical protein